MNCNEANEILERMVFEDVPAEAGFTQHVDGCPSCGKAYREALKARKVMDLVRRADPQPSDLDEITGRIMSAIQPVPSEAVVVPLWLRRMLSAAAIALFLVFGYEQYGVVRKVSALEEKFSGIGAEAAYFNPQNRATTIDIHRAGLSLAEIRRVISRANGVRFPSASSIKQQ